MRDKDGSAFLQWFDPPVEPFRYPETPSILKGLQQIHLQAGH
jgi:hypothetical protein